MMPVIIVVGFAVVIGLYVWSVYNGLIQGNEQIKEAVAQIDVQLKRRSDLIPNLIETVKGYAKHEKSIFEDVTKARSSMMKADSMEGKAKASDALSSAVKSILAIAENYPKLEANENFKQLQQELSDTEDKISYARQFYNTMVMDFNVKVQMFPSNMIAGNLGFKEQEFFKTTEEEKKNVKVNF